MEAALLTFPLFSLRGQSGAAKLLVLGLAEDEARDHFRSLNIEHVSAAEMVRQEISRSTPLGQQAHRARRTGAPLPDEVLLTPLRRWFWTRKPDAGFALTGFPATLLQAKVFDEWLDARGETLDAVIFGTPPIADPSARYLREYYGMQGVDCVDATPTAG